MANVKNFGLIGVGTSVQFGKAGPSLGQQTTTVLKAEGTAAFRLPAGTTVQQPAAETAGTGAMRFNSTLGSMEYSDGTTWQVVATGGNTGELTEEIDNIKASLGSMVNQTSGAWTGTGLSTTYFGLAPADLTAALTNLGTYVGARDTFDKLFAPGTAGNVIYSDGTNWLQAAPGATSGVQAYDAGLASIAGLTTSADQMIYTTGSDTYATTGLTSFARTLLDDADASTARTTLGVAIGTDVQAYDAGLAALAAKTSTGIMVQTGDDTYVSRTLVAPAAGITIADADGIAGNPTFALANDLAALEGLATTGYIVRTGDGTATTRSFGGTAGNIVVTNGDGVSSNTDIDLATVSQAASGSFVKVTLDGFGRVTGNTAVVASDITTLVDGTYVNVSGDTMTGNLSFGGTHKVTNLAEPTLASDAATKNYVDNAVTGLHWKQAANLLSATNVPLTGSNLVIDGHDPLVEADTGYRIVLINQTTASEDGIYVATIDGSGNYTLARSADADTFQELEGASIYILEGTIYGSTGWVQENYDLSSFSGQDWIQFSGSGAYSAGDGLLLTGTVFSVNMGAGITTLPSDEVGIDVVSGKAVQLTSNLAGGQLTFVLDTGSGMEQSETGLKISAGGVTNSMLANSSFTLNGDSGTQNAVALGDTLLIAGTSTQGISTVVTSDTITITAANASASQKGVATFNTASFDVTSGDVTIKTAGVSNTQLANSTITFTGTTGSDTVALGETLTFSSTVSGLVSSTVATNGIALDVRNATTSATGVASFSSTNFDVTAGAVSIKAGGVDLTTNVTGTLPVANGGTGATTFTAGRVLLGNGTSPIAEDAALAFDTTTDTLTVGTATIQGGATDVTITATGTDGDINLIPNGTGTVNIGSAGAGAISSDAGQALTVTGSSSLTLESTTGTVTINGVGDPVNETSGLVLNSTGGFLDIVSDGGIYIDSTGADTSVEITASGTNGAINVTAEGAVNVASNLGVVTISSGNGSTVMQLASEQSTDKVTVFGPTAQEYATDLAAEDLTNKQYVDDAIAAAVTGSDSGEVKAFKQVVSLASAGATNIGTVLPTGATILSVKVSVTAADTATGTLSVGVSGTVDAYMATTENDTQTTGLYLAECMVVNTAAQIIATVAGTPGGAGSATVVVTYQMPN